MENITNYLLNEMEKRNWKPADLAKRAGVDSGLLSRILNGERNAGPDTCTSIAQALNVPPEVVFRKAGILPSKPNRNTFMDELEFIFNSLPDNDREEILEIARMKLSLKERRGAYEAGKRHGGRLKNNTSEAGS